MDKTVMDYEQIAKTLFENYETIYDIDIESSSYKSFHESADYKRLELHRSGDDFFSALAEKVPDIIAGDDVNYVLEMLKKESLLAGLEKEKYYSFIYRIKRDGAEIYHQIRATYQPTEEGMHVFMGVRNIDSIMQRENMHRAEVLSMRQKESNHMQAVLASAAAYMEANLTKDVLIEKSDDILEKEKKFITTLPTIEEIPSYSDMHEWICRNLIVENKEKYHQIGSSRYLLNAFFGGERRASVLFSVYTKEGGVQPCREVFFLYEDDLTKDVHAFCVIYDLTEQQKKEQEVEELERELQMSRLKNFTSQMQPHFLYNALGSIQEVILMDPEYASELLGYFTVHLRSCIRAMTKDKPLAFSQELENVKAYINIEKMRLGDKLRVHYETETTRFNILPLTIQPIVENAIRHGIYGRGVDGGDVYIRTRDGGDSWIVQIEDNGIGFEVDDYLKKQKTEESDSTGIQNIKFRLEQVMKATLLIESTPGKGTSVTVHIPKEEINDESNYSG